MFWPLSKFQYVPHKIHCARFYTLTYVLHMVSQENSCTLQLVPWFGWKWSLNLCGWLPSSVMEGWLLIKWLPFINLHAAGSSWWASGSLWFMGYYVDDNARFYGFTASAGGRDSSWTSSGVSFLIINLGRVTKSTNILAFCGGGPVLIFTTDFSLILKLASISKGGGTVISCSL